MKKFTALFLVFSLMMLSTSLYAKERRGANLMITKKDGQQIEGELVTVKPNSLLLLDTEGKDVSVGIANIKVIRIVKKSKMLPLGAGFFLIGATVRGALHSSMRKEVEGEEATQHFVQASFAWGAIGLVAGIIIGMVAGMDKTIKIEGKSDSEIQKTLDKLRKKARVRDYK